MRFHNFLLFTGLAITLAGICMFLYGMYMISDPATATATATASATATATEYCLSYYLPTFFLGIFITLIGGIIKSAKTLNK